MNPKRKTLLDRAQALSDNAKANGRGLTDTERTEVQGLLLDASIDKLGVSIGDPAGGGGLYAAIQAAGYNRRSSPSVTVPFGAVAGFDGSYDDAVVSHKASPALGADARYLYPLLRQESVGSEVTGVASFRQKSRTLATAADMVRDIDAVSAKPETATETELLSVPLHQIATVETAVPNVMLEHSGFRDWINVDLSLSFARAVDTHVITQIDAETPTEVSEGANLLEGALFAAEEVMSQGYNPTILAADPADLIGLVTLNHEVNQTYVTSDVMAALEGLRRVPVPGLAAPTIIDPEALGVFYVSPLRLETFEEEAGSTNSSTVRLECHGAFVVQRIGAVATWVAGS